LVCVRCCLEVDGLGDDEPEIQKVVAKRSFNVVHR